MAPDQAPDPGIPDGLPSGRRAASADPTHPAGPSGSEPLARSLGLVALWLIVVNGIIGAGIFGGPAGIEAGAGGFSPWVFVLGALLIAPIMLSFARLSSAYVGTGGPVLYARTAFGPFVGFQIGWAFYIARLTAFAANLNLLATTALFWRSGTDPVLKNALVLAACAGLAWVNIVGARAAIRSLGVLTVLKLAPLAAIACVGLTRLDAGAFAAVVHPPAAGDLGAALLLAIYAYVGFESGLVPAGEARQPRQDLPRALLLALALVTVLYVLIQVAARSVLPDLARSQRPLVEVGGVLLGRPGMIAVVLAVIASVGGNLLGSMFSTSRITYRLALDAQLPGAFARVHPTHNTPWVSVLVFAGAAAFLAMSSGFAWLAVISVFTRLLIYMTCIASMARLRRVAPNPPSFRLPGGPLVPALAMLACIGLLTQASWKSVWTTAGLLGVGSVLYAMAMLSKRSTGTA